MSTSEWTMARCLKSPQLVRSSRQRGTRGKGRTSREDLRLQRRWQSLLPWGWQVYLPTGSADHQNNVFNTAINRAGDKWYHQPADNTTEKENIKFCFMSQDYKSEERIIKDIIYNRSRKMAPAHHLLQKYENIKSPHQESIRADKDNSTTNPRHLRAHLHLWGLWTSILHRDDEDYTIKAPYLSPTRRTNRWLQHTTVIPNCQLEMP